MAMKPDTEALARLGLVFLKHPKGGVLVKAKKLKPKKP
jgi:hypothetical protein